MGVSGNSVAGKSFQIFTVSEELLQKVTEAVQAGEKEARSSGIIQSFEVFCHGFRANISLGRIMIVPAAVCSDRQNFPTALLHGALVKVFGTGGEEISDLIEKRIGESEFDEYSQADFDSLKESLFVDPQTGEEACLIVFAPNWMNSREYICFHFTKDADKLKNNLRHQVFSAYYNPAVSSAFNALMTNVDTTKVDVTDVTPKLSYPWLSENPLKEFPRLDKQATHKKATILLNRKTADDITKQTLDPQELDVFDALDTALSQSLLPDADGAQGEGGFTAPEAHPGVPREAAAKKKAEEHEVDLKSKGKFDVNEGGLHRALGIPEDQTIPMSKLHSVMNGDYPEHVKNMARSAIGLKSMHKGGDKVAIQKVAYVSHCPGHKNSKGEAAPWCIRDHKDHHIINSFKSESEAKAGLRNMESHKGSLKKADDEVITTNPLSSHEAPFSNVGPGTSAEAEQENTTKAVKESLDDAAAQNEEKATSPIGIPIDENGVPRREDAKEPKAAGKKSKDECDSCYHLLKETPGKGCGTPEKHYGKKSSADKIAHINANGVCPGCKKAGKDCACNGCTCKQAAEDKTAKRTKGMIPTMDIRPGIGGKGDLSTYEMDRFRNGGYVDREHPKEIKAFCSTLGSDRQADGAVEDHSKQIAAGGYGDQGFLRSANEKWGSGEIPSKIKRSNKEVMADYIADVVAGEDEEPIEAMSSKSAAVRAKKEAHLDKFRPKIAVELDIDSIWDSITEDMGPAPLVEVEELETNPAPSNTEDQGGWSETTSGGGEAEAPETEAETPAPSTAPRKRDVQNLPEAFRSNEPEEEKEISTGEAEQEETGFENEVTQEEEDHYHGASVDSKYADFVGEIADEIDAEEALPGQRMSCPDCQMLSIQGVPCHEQGCPNHGARWDSASGNWVEQRKCTECGGTVDADDPCCSAEEFQERMEEPEMDAVTQECMASKTASTPNEKLGISPEQGAELISSIRPGDRVTILRPAGMGREGQEWAESTGRVVMRSSHGGWVLNMGGQHGTPGLADAGNIVRVRKGKQATGEMSQDEANNAIEWPMHHAIAKALGGKVKAFDQYQGPYILIGSEIRGQGVYAPATPMKGTVRLWLQSEEGSDGAAIQVYNEDNEQLSEPFHWDDKMAGIEAAKSVLDEPEAPSGGKKPMASGKKAERTVFPQETTKQTPGAYAYGDISGKAMPIAQPPTQAQGAAPSWVTSSEKTADTADNDYDIDAAANPTSKETGKSDTVECHEDYNEQQSKGAAKKKKADTADNPAEMKGGNGVVQPKTDADVKDTSGPTPDNTKQADGIEGDAAEAKAETVSPDTVDADIQQPTVDADKLAADKIALHFMNEYDIDEAVALLGNDPVLGKAVRFLRDFRDQVNSHSDGWAYWRQPVAAAGQLMTLIEAGMAKRRGYGRETDPSVVLDDRAIAKAMGPIKAFMTRRGTAAGMEMPKLAAVGEGWVSGEHADPSGQLTPVLPKWQQQLDSIERLDKEQGTDMYTKDIQHRYPGTRPDKVSADISGDMSEVKSEVDYNKAEVADESAATDTVNPEHFASKGTCAECGGESNLDNNDLCSECRHESKAAADRHDDVPEVDVPSSEDAKQPKSDLSGAAPEAHNEPAQIDSKEAAWGDDQPESIEFDFGAGDLADIVMSEDVDESKK